MPDFQIINAKPYHCGQMARRLVEEGDPLAVALGVTQTHREIRLSFDGSWTARAWTIDGALAALGGVMGSPVSTRGYVWFVLSELGRGRRLALVRMVREQIAEWAQGRHLMLAVASGTRSWQRDVRFACFLGFERMPDRTNIGLSRHAAVTFRYREAA